MKIAIGCDHGGVNLKSDIIELLKSRNIEVIDLGTNGDESVDYPDFAVKVGKCVSSGIADKGILMCGTGIGISIAANKVKGIRCAVCHNEFTAQMSAEHNNANIIALGGRIVSADVAVKIVSKWLDTEFAGGRHLNRVNKIMEIQDSEV